MLLMCLCGFLFLFVCFLSGITDLCMGDHLSHILSYSVRVFLALGLSQKMGMRFPVRVFWCRPSMHAYWKSLLFLRLSRIVLRRLACVDESGCLAACPLWAPEPFCKRGWIPHPTCLSQHKVVTVITAVISGWHTARFTRSTVMCTL